MTLGPRTDFPTWTLGYYLNSAELRVQAALHRLLRAYTEEDGKALPLARKVLDQLPKLDQYAAVRNNLHLFVQEVANGEESPSPLRRLWSHTNSLKHNEWHDPSFFLGFEGRFSDACMATLEVIELLEVLGTEKQQIDAA